jgi:hypothetical protein
VLNEPIRVSLYLPASVDQVARDLAKKQGISRNALVRRALGLLQAYETAVAEGQYVGTTRDREALEQVLIAPV